MTRWSCTHGQLYRDTAAISRADAQVVVMLLRLELTDYFTSVRVNDPIFPQAQAVSTAKSLRNLLRAMRAQRHQRSYP